MKISLPIIAILLLSAVHSFSQERPRYYDTFNTDRGVRVASEEMASPMIYNKSLGFGGRSASTKTNPSAQSVKPAIEIVLARKTARVTMTVYQGYAQPATPPSMTVRPTLTNRLVMPVGKYLNGYSTGDTQIDSYIVDSSRRYSIDPLLIYSQMGQESSYKERALSPKGASGLMQLMPKTAKRMGVTDIYDPQQNIEGGVKYMRLLLDMFGDVNLALAGYNAGEGAVMRYGNQIPPYRETQEYVQTHFSTLQVDHKCNIWALPAKDRFGAEHSLEKSV